MQAICHAEYGPFEQLRQQEITTPTIAADEVLIRVKAVGLHIGDCFGVRGTPFPMRLATGLVRPKSGIPGFDVAGEVVAIGERVTRFAVGDRVFGSDDRAGGCAEYARRSQERLAHVPANLSFEQAAALPISGLAALHALRDVANLAPGQRILINGAAGGIGHFAVQIAKAFGAHVTGVCSTRNVELVRSLGADQVIDYTREDFANGAQTYDVVLDNVENRPLAEVRRAVTPSGLLILNSGTGATGFTMFARLVKPLVLSPFVHQNLRRYLSTPNHADLVVLKDLVESGKLRPVLAAVYPMGEVVTALSRLEQGHVAGKTVLTWS